jgi:NAD(P)-dependent dehydrogenase (short-subunit alcohol dehydrogenase family)
MPQRAAIVTGGSSGIGLEIARMLGREGFGITLAARRPDKLEAAAKGLTDDGVDVQHVAGTIGDEAVVAQIVAAHRERFGRLDVLINNAGVGAGENVAELTTKKVDVQLATNLRSIILMYRDCTELLLAAAAERGSSLVVNTASISGMTGQPWLSVYSATKAGVIAFTEAMHRELGGSGVKNTALAPAFVDTPMTDFVKGDVPAEQMIRPTDIAIAVKALLDMSPACIVPEIAFVRPGDGNL